MRETSGEVQANEEYVFVEKTEVEDQDDIRAGFIIVETKESQPHALIKAKSAGEDKVQHTW